MLHPMYEMYPIHLLWVKTDEESHQEKVVKLDWVHLVHKVPTLAPHLAISPRKEPAMTDTTTGLYTTGEVPGVAEGLTVADGLFAIADALFGLTSAVQRLGNGDASTHMGAIENLSKQVRNGLDGIGSSLYEGLHQLSDQGAAPIYDARELDEDGIDHL